MLGTLWEASQPGVHQTNGRVERCNQDVLEGPRTLLVQAGLPSLFWPYATRCYCHLSNCVTGDDGASPWFRRHEPHLKGDQIPLGCGVFFLPASTKTVVSKADPRMVWGIFLGYRLAPGGRWSGEYLTAELTDFVDQSLRIDADSYDFRVTPPHHETGPLGLKRGRVSLESPV